ncbi:hypothetical protein SAMN05216338_104955 [Bradyrhizobium sp. Rc2d]|nr:hypothetical protein SAMN05216338_104955 [Bradyrhizobium sp. Rc2d]
MNALNAAFSECLSLHNVPIGQIEQSATFATPDRLSSWLSVSVLPWDGVENVCVIRQPFHISVDDDEVSVFGLAPFLVICRFESTDLAAIKFHHPDEGSFRLGSALADDRLKLLVSCAVSKDAHSDRFSMCDRGDGDLFSAHASVGGRNQDSINLLAVTDGPWASVSAQANSLARLIFAMLVDDEATLIVSCLSFSFPTPCWIV